MLYESYESYGCDVTTWCLLLTVSEPLNPHHGTRRATATILLMGGAVASNGCAGIVLLSSSLGTNFKLEASKP